MKYNKENYPGYLFWSDMMAAVVNGLNPDISAYVHIREWRNNVPHFIRFEELIELEYGDYPIIDQPANGLYQYSWNKNVLIAKAWKWKKKFWFIAESEKALFLIEKIKRCKQEENSLLAELANLDNYQDITKNIYSNANISDSVNINGSSTVLGSMVEMDNVNLSARTDSSSNTAITVNSDIRKGVALPNVNAQNLDSNVNDSLNVNLSKSSNISGNKGITTTIHGATTSSSNQIKDLIQYSNMEIRNFTFEFIRLFRPLFMDID